ncbi:MAG: hypothetical protein AAB817_00360 [Patescibacteria group bacterium]
MIMNMTAMDSIAPTKVISTQWRFPARAYFVASPTDPSVRLAMSLLIDAPTRTVRWHSTSRSIQVPLQQVIVPNPEHFVFSGLGADGIKHTYTVVPLTLEIYNLKIRPTMPQPLEFSDEEALLKFCEAHAG